MNIQFDTTHDCRRPAVAVMDHRQHNGFTDRIGHPMVNRMCLTCGTHWYGEADANVVAIPRQTWDRWMGEAA